MKLAANLHHLYQELPPLERLQAAAADGFDGVEWPFPYAHAPALLAARLRSAGLPLVLVNTPLGPGSEPGLAAVPGREAQFRDGLERALDLAQRTGCGRVHVMAGRPAGAADPITGAPGLDAATRALLQRRLQWAAALARQAGVLLLLEPLNRHDMPGYAWHRPSQVIDLIRPLGLPGLRLQFDLYHAEREGLRLPQALHDAAGWIGHVQLAQAPDRSAPDLARPATVEALQVLAGLPHGGWLGLEYHPHGRTADSLGWRQPLRALLQRLAQPA